MPKPAAYAAQFAFSREWLRGGGRAAELTIATISPFRRPSSRSAAPAATEEGGASRSRDSFVADTALKLEQLQATVRLLTRDVGQLAGKVAELQEAGAQESRAYLYQQNEKR